MKINPWSNDLLEDYEFLFKDFGLQHLEGGFKERFASSRLFRRSILFAHRGFDEFVKDADSKKKVAAITGIKPSNEFHLGTKLTAEELVFMQKEFNARVYYAIADNEALADNGIPYEESEPIAIDNVADLLALGLDPKNAIIYKQSECLPVLNFAQLAARRTTTATLDSLYGHQNLALYLAALTQAGDIIQPLFKENNFDRVVVPVGLDQDPHIRFSRDLASKLGYPAPTATYHRIFRALNGESKMSKREPDSLISLGDSEEDVKRKVSKAFTGGRSTVEEQKEQGAEWAKCVVYELLFVHFEEDDAELEKLRAKCEGGEIMCGECKLNCIKKVNNWLKEHQKKKAACMNKARELVEGN